MLKDTDSQKRVVSFNIFLIIIFSLSSYDKEIE